MTQLFTITFTNAAELSTFQSTAEAPSGQPDDEADCVTVSSNISSSQVEYNSGQVACHEQVVYNDGQ